MLVIKQQEPYRYQQEPIGQGLLSHKRHRLRLYVLLDLRSSPTVLSASILIAQSKPGRAHDTERCCGVPYR